MNYYIRKMETEKDEITDTIRLLYAPKVHKLPFHFENESECIEIVSRLMMLDDTEYSAKNFWVCTDGNRVVGAIHAYVMEKIESKKALATYSSVRKDKKFDRDYKIWRESTKPLQNFGRSFYIHNGHYDEDKSEEISELLINAVCAYCKSINFTHVYTDVRQSATEKMERLKKINFSPVRVIDDESFEEPFVRMAKTL